MGSIYDSFGLFVNFKSFVGGMGCYCGDWIVVFWSILFIYFDKIVILLMWFIFL